MAALISNEYVLGGIIIGVLIGGGLIWKKSRNLFGSDPKSKKES